MKNSWKMLDAYKFNLALSKLKNCIPNKKEILLKPFSFFEYPETKIVFLGLSPYRTLEQATGLCFANPTKNMQPSLQVIVDALAMYLHHPFIEEDFDPTLEYWARQGILLLNAALTVPFKGGTARSHLTIWEPFIEDTLKKLDKLDNVAFCFFGKDAATYSDTIEKNKIFKYVHPAATARRRFDKNEIDIQYDFRKQHFFKNLEPWDIEWIKNT